MASFDIKSRFTNIPLTKTIGLCVETHMDSLPKSYFLKLLEMTMCESFFIFDQKYYKQRNHSWDPHWPMCLCVILRISG